jgi:hypothetical protein
VEQFKDKINEAIENTQLNSENRSIEEKWQRCKTVMVTAAEQVLGIEKKRKRNEWYDDECERLVKERNVARIKMLQRRTRMTVSEYENKRRLVKSECRKKKRMFERANLENIEELAQEKKIRQLYMKTGLMKKGYQPRTTFCKDKRGDLIGDSEGIVKRWAEYFEELLNKPNTIVEQEQEEEEFYGPEPDVKNPSKEEVVTMIKELKNNKAPGEDKITGEIIKYGGEKLWDLIHELISNIWEQEEMPKEWSVAIIHPIHKKNDKTNCSNYRGISLLNVTYKVMAKIIAKRLTPYTEEILGDYQCGFRKTRTTTDHIFALRNIMEKCYEYNISLHQLFIDYKQAYDSVNRNKLFVTMKEFGIPTKIVHLTKMTLRETKAKVKIQSDMSGEFTIDRGLRQGDVLSTQLFNITLEKIMRSIEINRGGTIFNRSLQYLAYADDVNLISRNTRELSKAFVEMEGESKKAGLIINEAKTNYMINTRNKVRFRDTNSLQIQNYNFQRITEFKYLGSLANDSSENCVEIKARIAAGNRCYFAFLKLLKSSVVSRNTKKRIYRSIIRPVVTYGAETLTSRQKKSQLSLS